MKKSASEEPFKDLQAYVRWRRKQGASAEDVARDLQISRSYLSMILSGQRTPSLKVIHRAEAFGIPINSWSRSRGVAAA